MPHEKVHITLSFLILTIIIITGDVFAAPQQAAKRRYVNPLAVDSYPVSQRRSGLPDNHPALTRDPRDKLVDFRSPADPTVCQYR